MEYETAEHVLTCKSVKIAYNQDSRLTFLASQLRQLKFGANITPIFAIYIRNLLKTQMDELPEQYELGTNTTEKR